MNTTEYFNPGDLVVLNKPLPNAPTMLVLGKEKNILKRDKDKDLRGIRCMWFSTTGVRQEGVFSTKDLKKA